MDTVETIRKPMKLLMREEVLETGAPLPLADLIEVTPDLSVHDETVKTIWAETMAEMKTIVGRHWPAARVVMPKLWADAAAKKHKLDGSGAVAVTLDAYDTTGAIPQKVSRHFASGGARQVGIGKRPGAPSLDDQLKKIAATVGHAPIVLLDDDTATGGTASEVIKLMQEAGLSISKFIPGLQASDVQEIRGVPVEPILRYDQVEVLDVIDPRDFLFGLKDAGLVIRDDGYLYRAPYILPWVDLTIRASFPTESVRDFSVNIVRLNHSFYTRLEKLVGRTILIADSALAFQIFVEKVTNCLPGCSMTDLCSYSERLLTNPGILEHDEK